MPATADGPDWLWRLRWRRLPRLASRFRLAMARASHRHATVVIPKSVYAADGFRLEIPGPGTLEIGEGVRFRGAFYCEISGSGRVRIGAGTVFSSDATIQCTTTIDIREGSVIGKAAVIADGAHRFRDWTKHTNEQGYNFRPIVIGPEALVHAQCTIVASIGLRSVVGAGSLVNRDIPDYSLAGGVPARVLEYFGPPRDAALVDG
jgi:acetyltransferase-like isoleucine patch superfamily enzyme